MIMFVMSPPFHTASSGVLRNAQFPFRRGNDAHRFATEIDAGVAVEVELRGGPEGGLADPTVPSRLEEVMGDLVQNTTSRHRRCRRGGRACRGPSAPAHLLP